MLVPLLHYVDQLQLFRPVTQEDSIGLLDTVGFVHIIAEIIDLFAQSGIVGIDQTKLFDLHEITSANNLFPAADSEQPLLITTDIENYTKYEHLFNYYILVKAEGSLLVEQFLYSQNELLFADDCPGTACRDECKTRIIAQTERFVLTGRYSPQAFIHARMAEGAADLHIHTTASDSSDTPEEVCSRVIAAGLKTFAITDHDNTEAAAAICECLSGYTEAGKTAINLPVFIPGTEISVQEERELHLLAYFPYGGYDRLKIFLHKQQQAREQRNLDMIATLQSLGYDISIDELNSSGDYSVGRMQMALLLKARGYVKTTSQAFAELLGYGMPGYIERPRPSLQEAIYEIRITGGVPVLAHPALYGWCNPVSTVKTMNELVKRFSLFKSWGLIGIECFHGEADKKTQHLLSEIALELQMLRTGGSDDHGHNKLHTKLFDRNTSFY